MADFRDRQDRRWTIDITIATAKRVRDATGVNLLTMLDDPDQLSRLVGDPITLVDVLYVICKPEADERKVTDVQFGESLSGDALEMATEALLESLVSFFPNARRKVMRRVLDRAIKQSAAVNDRLMTLIEDGSIDREIDKAFAESRLTSSTKSGESPEPQESTPEA